MPILDQRDGRLVGATDVVGGADRYRQSPWSHDCHYVSTLATVADPCGIHRDHRRVGRVSRTHLVRVVLVTGAPSANDTLPAIRVVDVNLRRSNRTPRRSSKLFQVRGSLPGGRA